MESNRDDITSVCQIFLSNAPVKHKRSQLNQETTNTTLHSILHQTQCLFLDSALLLLLNPLVRLLPLEMFHLMIYRPVSIHIEVLLAQTVLK
jgi:hypothetical protein